MNERRIKLSLCSQSKVFLNINCDQYAIDKLVAELYYEKPKNAIIIHNKICSNNRIIPMQYYSSSFSTDICDGYVIIQLFSSAV